MPVETSGEAELFSLSARGPPPSASVAKAERPAGGAPMAEMNGASGDVHGMLLELTWRMEDMGKKQDANFAAQQKQMTEMQKSLEKLEFENRMLRAKLGSFKEGETFPERLRRSTSETKPAVPLPTLESQLTKIRQLLDKAPEKVELEHAFFLSHYQAEAADIAGILDLQMKIRGYKCWYDQDATHITQTGMLEGIRSSAVFMLILTKGVFQRPWCLFEVRSAMHLRKPIQLLHEAETSRACFATLQEIIASAPEDMKVLFSEHESLPFRRKVYEQQALLDRLLLSWSEPLEELAKERLHAVGSAAGSDRADAAPSVLASREMAKIVHGGRKTATLFIDLGTGQIAFKLLALAGDGHLAYTDLLTISFNIVTGRPAYGSPECDVVEREIEEAIARVIKLFNHTSNFVESEWICKRNVSKLRDLNQRGPVVQKSAESTSI